MAVFIFDELEKSTGCTIQPVLCRADDIGDLPAGQTVVLTSSQIQALAQPGRCQVAGDVTNIATVDGASVATGDVVSDSDPAVVTCQAGPAVCDVDADGDIDADDFTLFAAAEHTDLSGMSPYELYTNGDMDGDGDNDYYDFRLFKADYIAANGAEEFAALVAAVPEPSSLLLAVFCLFPLAYRRG